MRKTTGAALLAAVAIAAGCGKSGGGGGGGGGQAAAAAGAGQASYAASASENLAVKAEDVMAAPDLASLLDRTVGAAAASGASPAVALPLRNGLFLTAVPSGANILLRFEIDPAGAGNREAFAEVPIPAALGRTFADLVSAAMSTMALTVATPGLAQPWKLVLWAGAEYGGDLNVVVEADAQASFTLCWMVKSPARAIDAYALPAAFGSAADEGGKASISGTVHFPISLSDFQVFVNRAYGKNAPQRFTDFGLIPHTWLRLTVTGDAANRVVNVHFDAVTNAGARLFVAEAPASTAVGGRFFDETVARMQEMLDEEAKSPGSSRKWGTNFYYASAQQGVVEVVVAGEKGSFDIAYRVVTPEVEVKP